MDLTGTLYTIALVALPLLLAITLHEAAHGWMADRKGDDTARMLGRVTMNPVRHIDPFGSIILPLMLLLMNAPFLFGWAKPVPVAFHRLRNPKTDMAWVAAAGPGANLILAVLSGLLVQLILTAKPELTPLLWQGSMGSAPGLLGALLLMLKVSVQINLLLMLFNLLPIPPLDGGRIVVGLLPRGPSMALSRVEPYGMVILVVVVFMDPLGIMGGVLWPLIGQLSALLLLG